MSPSSRTTKMLQLIQENKKLNNTQDWKKTAARHVEHPFITGYFDGRYVAFNKPFSAIWKLFSNRRQYVVLTSLLVIRILIVEKTWLSLKCDASADQTLVINQLGESRLWGGLWVVLWKIHTERCIDSYGVRIPIVSRHLRQQLMMGADPRRGHFGRIL